LETLAAYALRKETESMFPRIIRAIALTAALIGFFARETMAGADELPLKKPAPIEKTPSPAIGTIPLYCQGPTSTLRWAPSLAKLAPPPSGECSWASALPQPVSSAGIVFFCRTSNLYSIEQYTFGQFFIVEVSQDAMQSPPYHCLKVANYAAVTTQNQPWPPQVKNPGDARHPA